VPEEYLALCQLIDKRRRARPAGATFVVGIAGGVAVCKTTSARRLQSLLDGSVERVSTDAFLFPNSELERRRLALRKGFPESYDLASLQQFLAAVRAGASDASAPVYDHRVYDVIAGERHAVGHPEVLILEGCNVLQAGIAVDLGIYLDAATSDIRRWFVARFIDLARQAAGDEGSFFAPWSGYGDDQLTALAESVWDHINEVNLTQHILPTRERADVIVRKDADHRIVDIVEVRCGG